MRLNTGILLSLLALETAVGAPASQYESDSVIAAGSAQASVSAAETSVSAMVSPSGSAVASATGKGGKSCKAKSNKANWAQLWGEHRRPRVRPSALEASSASPPLPTGQPDPRPSTNIETPAESAKPSVVVTEIAAGASEAPVADQPSQIEMPSAAESAPVVGTVIANKAAAGNGGGEQRASEVAQPPASSPAAQSSGGSGGAAPAGFEADILNAHNVFRATYGAQPLVWDQGLADQGHAYFKDRNCALAHSGMENGENLTAGGGKFTGQGVLDGWASEAKDWNSKKGFTTATGHFTQVVWKETTRLGCGIISCGSLAFCEYQKPGNEIGPDFAKNVVKS